MINKLGPLGYKDRQARVGRKGGISVSPEKRPFALDRELASRAGRIGGKRSRRES